MSFFDLFMPAVTYRDFKIEVNKGQGNLFYYAILSDKLTFPIMDGMGEATRERAIGKAKEFIDDHF